MLCLSCFSGFHICRHKTATCSSMVIRILISLSMTVQILHSRVTIFPLAITTHSMGGDTKMSCSSSNIPPRFSIHCWFLPEDRWFLSSLWRLQMVIFQLYHFFHISQMAALPTFPLIYLFIYLFVIRADSYSVDYNPSLYLFHLMLKLGTWESPFPAVPVPIPCAPSSTSLLPGTRKCSRLTLYLPCPRTGES